MTDIMTQIVQRCLSMDEMAQEVYHELSRSVGLVNLKEFWETMACQEEEHVAYWRELLVRARVNALPEVIDHAERVEAELAAAEQRVQQLLTDCQGLSDTQRAFLMAYRLEFYLMHPIFNRLFRLADMFGGGNTLEQQYEDHLGGFVDKLTELAQSTPELELIGDALRRLWSDNQQWAAESTRDFLTGVMTRRALVELMTPLAFLAARSEKTVALLMVDIDGFKQINDSRGHTEGDSVLRAVAGALRVAVRRSDLIGRYGGDEFLIFAFGIDPDRVKDLAERIRKGAAQSSEYTVSVGAAWGALAQPVEQSLQDLIAASDQALYKAKAAGKNSFHVEEA